MAHALRASHADILRRASLRMSAGEANALNAAYDVKTVRPTFLQSRREIFLRYFQRFNAYYFGWLKQRHFCFSSNVQAIMA